MAYCYDTEINFHKYTGVSIDKFDATNPEHVFNFIRSAIIAFCHSKGEEGPSFNVDELKFKAKPKELIEALTEIFQLRAEWYDVPAGDTDDEESDDKQGKND